MSPLRLVLASDEQRQRPATLARHVLQLEVVDVDPLGAEGLRDAGEDTGPVGYVHAQPLERARLVVGLGEHPAAVTGRLRDPAREEAGVAFGERALDLLDAATMLGERAPERLGVVEEDVDPDPWVRAGDTRHVAE